MALAEALGMDGAAVQLDDVADDGQADAQAAVMSGAGGVSLAETIEDIGEELRIDADAVVGDFDLDIAALAGEADLDLAAAVGEFDGVGEEVPHHLLHAVGVAGHVVGFGLKRSQELNLLGIGGRAHGIERGLDDGVEGHGADIEAHLAGHDARDIQKIFDELGLGADVSLDDFQAMGGVGGVELAHAEQARPAQHGVQRRAQLVAEGGEEFIFHPIGFAGFGKNGVFNSDGGHLGELDEDRLVILVEIAISLVGKLEQADISPIAAHQRSGQEAGKALRRAGSLLHQP